MWRERELQTHIISGENKIPLYYGFGVDWYYSHSQARLYEPDKRDYRYLDPEDNVVGNYQFGNLLRDDAYFRRYENMQDRALDVGAKMHLPIPIWGQRRAKLTVGAARLNKRRKSKVKRFSLVYRDHSSLSKEQHLAQNGLKPGDDLQTQLENCDDCYNYRDVTSNTDSYVAEQSVNAIFLESKWPVFGWLDFNMGVRNERSVQSVRTFDLFGDGSSAIESRLKTRDLMPASSLNFKVNDKMKVRLAYSETVSRPDFRELSATRWEDDDLDIEVEGNPDLQATIIKNTDIRWEWYFERKENISFGLFSKSFKNPIEAVRVPAADPVITFQNAQSALNYGFEVEFRKMIKDIKGLSLSGNYSVIQSNINISNVDTNLTNKSRPLQGQSPYAINLMLDYENERYNFATSLLYNIVGKRIFQVGNLSQPDIYEQPIPQLDFVASKSFSKSTKVRFKFKNIFNARSTLTQGDRVYRQVVRGQSVSIGISTQI